MHIKDVYSLADEYFARHNLSDWKFAIGKRAKSLGVCKYSTKTIELSYHYLHIDDSQIKDTLLHEIAHALVGHSNGHNHVWQRKAIEIGAKPERCASGVESAKEPNYYLVCPKCARKVKVFRKPKREKSCGICCPKIYNPMFKLILVPNQ